MYDISFETNLGVALQHFSYKFFKDEITYHCNDFEPIRANLICNKIFVIFFLLTIRIFGMYIIELDFN